MTPRLAGRLREGLLEVGPQVLDVLDAGRDPDEALGNTGPGAAFGELALLDKAPRNATVTAETDMELVVLGQREFGGVIDEVPGVARKLLTGMARRLREADAHSVQ